MNEIPSIGQQDPDKINFQSNEWRILKKAITRHIDIQTDVCLNATNERIADKARGAVEQLKQLLQMEKSRPA